MPKRICSAPGCTEPHHANGYCSVHAARWRRRGDLNARPYLRGDLTERFWPWVDKSNPDGCWPWTRKTDPNGYGRFGPKLAHRIAWTLTFGPIPEGLDVLHHCDNPPCCNPYRCLFLGTQADNVADMHAKGRGGGQFTAERVAGERHHAAKLTQGEVEQIRRIYAGGATSQAALAARFGVHFGTISKIVRGRTWAT